MKFKNLFQFYFNYKARNRREKAVQLALKSNVDSACITQVASQIENYITSGTLSN